MWYICVKSLNWADECDVHFGELIDEDIYQKYQYLKEKFPKGYYGDYWFGTNEGWEDDFNYLQFEFKPITGEEVVTLRSYHLPNGEEFIEPLFDILTSELEEMFPEDCYETKNGYTKLKEDLLLCSLDTFKYYIDKLCNASN